MIRRPPRSTLFPTRRSSDLIAEQHDDAAGRDNHSHGDSKRGWFRAERSEEHTSELQSQSNLVCRLLLEKKKTHILAGPAELTIILAPSVVDASLPRVAIVSH